MKNWEFSFTSSPCLSFSASLSLLSSPLPSSPLLSMLCVLLTATRVNFVEEKSDHHSLTSKTPVSPTLFMQNPDCLRVAPTVRLRASSLFWPLPGENSKLKHNEVFAGARESYAFLIQLCFWMLCSLCLEWFFLPPSHLVRPRWKTPSLNSPRQHLLFRLLFS